MICEHENTAYAGRVRDDSVSGGWVTLRMCEYCGEIIEDVPVEVADERRDLEMTEQGEKELQ